MLTEPPACPLGVLPGVRRHVSRVAEDLREGRSCVWLLPAAMARPARVEQLMELLQEHVRLKDVPPPTPVIRPAPARAPAAAVVGSIEEMLAGVFGPPVGAPPPPVEVSVADLTHRVLQAAHDWVGVPSARTREPLVALAELRAPAGFALVIRADDEPDPAAVGALLRRYTALLREYPIRVDRPALLVVGSPANLSDVGRDDPLTTGVHWWWGVLSRLDLLTVATVEAGIPDRSRAQRTCLDGLCADLVPEVVAEVAGSDLDLAAALVREWDGTRADLVRQVAKTVEDGGSTEVADLGGGVAGDRPAPRLREHWATGRVEAWGGRVRPAVSAVSDAALDDVVAERLWIGQSRALNPALDEIRRTLVALVRAGTSVSVLAELDRQYCAGGGVEAIELTYLRQAAQKQIVTLAPLPRKLLDEAVFARNALAHRQVVEDRRLREIHRLIPLTVDGP